MPRESSNPSRRSGSSLLSLRSNLERLEDRCTPAATPSLVSAHLDADGTTFTGVDGPVRILGSSEFGDFLLIESSATNLYEGQITPPGQVNLFRYSVGTTPTNGKFELISRFDPPANSKFANQTTPSGAPIQKGLGVVESTPTRLNAVMTEDGKSVAFLSTANANGFNNTIPITSDGGGADLFVWNENAGAPTVTLASLDRNAKALGGRGQVTSPFISPDGQFVSFVSTVNAELVVDTKYLNVDLTPQLKLPPNTTVGGTAPQTLFDEDNTPDLFRAAVGQTPEIISFNYTRATATFSYTIITNGVTSTQDVSADYIYYTMHGDIRVDSLDRYSTIGVNGFVAIRENTNDLWSYDYAGPGILINFQYQLLNQPRSLITDINGNSPGGKGLGQFDNVIYSRQSGDAFFTYRDLTPGTDGDLVPGYVNNNGGDYELYRARFGAGSTGVVVDLMTADIADTDGTPSIGSNGKLYRSSDFTGPDPRGYVVNPDGSYLSFTSTATNLVTPDFVDGNGALSDVFQRRFATNVTSVVSVTNSNRKLTGNQGSRFPTQSDDGLVIGFESDATDLTSVTDANKAADLFVNDIVAEETLLVSVGNFGVSSGNASSLAPMVISRIAFPDPATDFYRHFQVFFGSNATDLDSAAVVDPTNVAFPADGQSTPQLYNQTFPVFVTKLIRTFAYSGGNGGYVSLATLDPKGKIVTTNKFQPFAGYTGEIRVASADFNGDGVLDVAVGAGQGGGPRVRIIDGFNGRPINDFYAFEPSFTGGVYLAAADINGDGNMELLVGAGEGGGPRIQMYDSTGTFRLMDGFAYEPGARTGVRVATGDVNGDSRQDIITGAGIGGGPRIRVFDGMQVPNLVTIQDFFAFEQTLRSGAYLSSADFNADGYDDIAVGGGPDGGPRVRVFNARNITGFTDPSLPKMFVDFFAFDSNLRTGARPVLRDINGDKTADLVVGTGAGFPKLRTFLGDNQGGTVNPVQVDEINPFDSLLGQFGAWVG